MVTQEGARELVEALVASGLIELQQLAKADKPASHRTLNDLNRLFYGDMTLGILNVEREFMAAMVGRALDGDRVQPGTRRPLNGRSLRALA